MLDVLRGEAFANAAENERTGRNLHGVGPFSFLTLVAVGCRMMGVGLRFRVAVAELFDQGSCIRRSARECLRFGKRRVVRADGLQSGFRRGRRLLECARHPSHQLLQSNRIHAGHRAGPRGDSIPVATVAGDAGNRQAADRFDEMPLERAINDRNGPDQTERG